MLVLKLSKDVLKFLQGIERKHAGQLALKILSLLNNPHAPDVKQLRGAMSDYLRADMGEYRLIFRIVEDELQVILVGKRNDDEVYQEIRRK